MQISASVDRTSHHANRPILIEGDPLRVQQARRPACRTRCPVDGIEIVASLVLLSDRRALRRSGWLPWVALAIGTVGSLAANIATAGPAAISRLIAG